mmetsp:Transcript_8691/g.22368  ORF Transcript_8691/g.22368 Transcript_8691/m.22368 type:complete len:203 (+) Transcript_8691:497-1105(+)
MCCLSCRSGLLCVAFGQVTGFSGRGVCMCSSSVRRMSASGSRMSSWRAWSLSMTSLARRASITRTAASASRWRKHAAASNVGPSLSCAVSDRSLLLRESKEPASESSYVSAAYSACSASVMEIAGRPAGRPAARWPAPEPWVLSRCVRRCLPVRVVGSAISRDRSSALTSRTIRLWSKSSLGSASAACLAMILSDSSFGVMS